MKSNIVKELDFKDKYPMIFSDFENIVRDGRKHNIIDRFFHYSIEETKMIKDINNQNLTEEIKHEIFKEIEIVFKEFKTNLIYKIKYCFGLHSFSSYIKNGKTGMIENPFLLGISPFLFDQIEWEDVMISEIKKSRYDITNLYNIELMIRNSLNDALYRLDKKEFDNLQSWTKNKISPEGLVLLIKNKIFETTKSAKSTDSIIKEIVKKHTVINSSRIILMGNFTTGKLIDKIIEGFAAKNIQLNNEERNDIKSFVSQNFKNSKGKNLAFKELKHKDFFNHHKILLKNILIANKKSLKCEDKDISRIIHKTLPELGELKTIENY